LLTLTPALAAIYQKNMNGSGYDSNRERALLMKTNFVNDYKQATQAEGAPPRVLFEFAPSICSKASIRGETTIWETS
jgi:hypothetical protein